MSTNATDNQPILRAIQATPVFVLGVKGRSGTGFLSELLRAHPDCAAPPEPLTREDWLLMFSSNLSEYVTTISNRRRYARFGPKHVPGFENELMRSLGLGLMSFIGQACGSASHVVLKSPSLHGLGNGLRLFPQGKMLIVIRNGRDSVESSLRSWPTDPDGSEVGLAGFAQRWADGASELLALMDRHPGRFLSLRYEDLVLNLAPTLHRALRYIGLDSARYDFDAAVELPVYGSSSFGLKNGAVNYDPQQKSTSFAPLSRAAAWEPQQHREFNSVAGAMMRAFGYPLVEPD